MIPKRTLTATLEISTGSMIITNRPPAFTGEADALTINVSLLDGGAAYAPIGNVLAKLYLYWQGTPDMSEAVDLTISGNTLTGSLPDTLTAVPGCPLLVIQLTDADSGDLIVAAATPIQITNVLGERVISSRPATPSEIIYIGRSPYIDMTTGHWMQWDTASSGYIDTGVTAAGRPATFTAVATTLPAGSAATASITGTPDAPILNLGIPKGQDGQDSAVLSVNGQTGAVQLNDENIPSNIDGKANVEAVLSYHSQQIGTLVTAEAKTFKDGIEVTLPNVSDTNRTFAVAGITANHSLVQEGYAYLSNPSAAAGDLDLVTADGTVTVSGTLTGTTNIVASFVIKQQSATGTAAS